MAERRAARSVPVSANQRMGDVRVVPVAAVELARHQDGAAGGQEVVSHSSHLHGERPARGLQLQAIPHLYAEIMSEVRGDDDHLAACHRLPQRRQMRADQRPAFEARVSEEPRGKCVKGN